MGLSFLLPVLDLSSMFLSRLSHALTVIAKLFLACWTKRPAGIQCSAGHFESLSDIFPVDDWQISVFILVFLVGHFMWVEPCWTKFPARSELSVGHQQKSARHVRHISRSLLLHPDPYDITSSRALTLTGSGGAGFVGPRESSFSRSDSPPVSDSFSIRYMWSKAKFLLTVIKINAILVNYLQAVLK